jgi:hypothetical protein
MRQRLALGKKPRVLRANKYCYKLPMTAIKLMGQNVHS